MGGADPTLKAGRAGNRRGGKGGHDSTSRGEASWGICIPSPNVGGHDSHGLGEGLVTRPDTPSAVCDHSFSRSSSCPMACNSCAGMKVRGRFTIRVRG